MHELPAVVSFPDAAELRVRAPVASTIEASTLGHSVATGENGIAGELLDVGGGGFRDYEGKHAAGRIVLCELSLSPARHEKQRIAALMGSAGAIMINWGAPESTAIPFGSVKSAWARRRYAMRAEMPTLPCIGIAREAGLRLQEMSRGGHVEVWLRTQVENPWRPVQITVGEIRAPHGDEFVLVGGHQDSWFGEAATDNAAGNACVLELARVFNRHRDKLRRGIVFGFWTAHETGTMSGSAWYADREWDRLRENAVGYMQVDQPACVEAGIWGSWSNTEMKRFHQTVERRLLGQREIIWERAGKMGDASLLGLGIPMLQGNGVYSREPHPATAGATFGWWHHTLDNTLDKLDWNDMGEHLRVYGSWPVGTLHRADPALRVRHRRGRVDRAAACAAAGGRVSRAGKHPGAGPPVQGSRGPARPCRAGAARAQRRRVGRFRDARRRAQPLPEAPVTPADPGPEHDDRHLRARHVRLHAAEHDDPEPVRRGPARRKRRVARRSGGCWRPRSRANATASPTRWPTAPR